MWFDVILWTCLGWWLWGNVLKPLWRAFMTPSGPSGGPPHGGDSAPDPNVISIQERRRAA